MKKPSERWTATEILQRQQELKQPTRSLKELDALFFAHIETQQEPVVPDYSLDGLCGVLQV